MSMRIICVKAPKGLRGLLRLLAKKNKTRKDIQNCLSLRDISLIFSAKLGTFQEIAKLLSEKKCKKQMLKVDKRL